MTAPIPARTFARTSAVSCLALLLSGCFLTPGTFTSELMINDDGRFAYSYDGEISILGVGQLAEMGAAAGEDEFEAEPCYDGDGDERDCSAAELSQQRDDWEANAPAREMERAQQAQMVKLMLGEVDLSDPEKVAEFARKLERQEGWNTVTYREDGLFEVSYRLDGQLTHDFLFPVIEGFPMPGAFVQVYRRDGNVVRVEAPGFSGGASGPAGGMGSFGQLMGMASQAAPKDAEGPKMPKIAPIDGQFRIVTNATILANNTDEGPVATPTGYVLSWRIDQQTDSSPTALIQLQQ
ncbi:hypothetical protein [Parerythrobacter aestuarii]|uniref:hypothetical protein n=1 Tax=Parerythrobacter aestuarii TaxID=3020909 RepID=UPI0024DE8D3C|nr:hypothetical protein [Parerythrobacter aestuarii]